ncbi:hypothetical protein FRC09_010458 [Ceratobasidium sp. 395]|nr:hypothetical protein FRC09_010458 [Ceratobasidium sp. 395]
MSLTPKSVEFTPAPTLTIDQDNLSDKQDDNDLTKPTIPALANAKPARKYVLLAVFCLGQFLDTVNTSAMFPAIPAISRDVGLTESDSVWLFAAYQATFASFLLISGRISDVYSPKPVFVLGTGFFGLTTLAGGFPHDKISFLVLRALQGIGASLTIPSSLNLIVQMFPDRREQGRAFGWYSSWPAVLGTMVGAILVQYASWRWIFWLISIIAIPISIACVLLIPKTPRNPEHKKTKFDFVGVFMLTVSAILFVYALTSGSVEGWTAAGVLAPLFVSIALATSFFVWETRIDERNASLPPKLWFYPNFAVLFAVALMPYFCLPLGVVAGPIMLNAGRISQLGRPKWMILGGLTCALIASLMFPFSARRYWQLDFPAFIIGTAGNATVFVLTNIHLFRTTPPRYAGVVGAVFNSALQLGCAVGTAATTSIQASVDARNPHDETAFKGRAAALWCLVAVVGLEMIGVAIFFRPVAESPKDEESVEAEKNTGSPATSHQ